MASKKFDKAMPEWKLFTDFWALCQKTAVVENEGAYWDNLVAEADRFSTEYENKGDYCRILSNMLAVAILDTMNKIGALNRHNV